jgi:hypothetical protein
MGMWTLKFQQQLQIGFQQLILQTKKESPASPAVGEQEDAAAQENEASSAT